MADRIAFQHEDEHERSEGRRMTLHGARRPGQRREIHNRAATRDSRGHTGCCSCREFATRFSRCRTSVDAHLSCGSKLKVTTVSHPFEPLIGAPSGSKIVDAALDGGVDRGVFFDGGPTTSLLTMTGQSLSALLIRLWRSFLAHDPAEVRRRCDCQRLRSRTGPFTSLSNV